MEAHAKSNSKEILTKLRRAIKALPPCEEGCVRLWRGAVIDSDKYKVMYQNIRNEILQGTFVVDTPQKKILSDRIISKKDKLVGLFYSDSLAATLPYFLRHNEDVDAERMLYYIDVPIPVAKNNYFANVASNLLGAIHHENIFYGIIYAATTRSKLAKDLLANLPPSDQSPDQSADDFPIDLDSPLNKMPKYIDEIETQDARAESTRSRQLLHQKFIDAFQTCNFKDIQDEFYLPENLVQHKRRRATSIDGKTSIAVSDKEWKKIGEQLDREFNPELFKTRKALKFKDREEAVKSWFGTTLNDALEM